VFAKGTRMPLTIALLLGAASVSTQAERAVHKSLEPLQLHC